MAEIYIVNRMIQSKHQTSFTVPMGAFGERSDAVEYQNALGQEIKGLMEFRLVSPRGELLVTSMRETLGGIGIAGMGHFVDGPINLKGDAELEGASSRIILPHGHQH